MQAASATIERLVDQIVVIAHPLRIVLFGSAARDEMGPDSDIDVLVVMPDGADRRRTAQDLYRRVRGIGRPFDLVVATPSDLALYGENPGLIYATILREGREVYAA